MAFQRVPNTAEVAVIYTLNGIVCQNVFYGEFAGGYSLLDLQVLAGAVDAAVGVGWLPDQPAEATYLRCEVRGLDTEFDLFTTDNTSTGVGTDVIPSLPNNVTFSIKKISGLTGRSARGRSYWIGIPRDKLKGTDENELTTAYTALIVANIELIRTTIAAAAGWAAVLVSRVSNGVPRTPTAITFPWVGTVAVDERIDTQRPRLN